MGAAEARALWQRRASRCFLVHEDPTMPPKLACCHHQQQQQQHSSSSSSAKNSFSSTSFGDSSDFSSDTKWWLKGSANFDEEIANSFLHDTKLQQLVDLTGISKEKEEEEYGFVSKKDIATTPWWRSTTDQDELALLVATRSLDHHNIQNCDLPPPQKLHKSIHCTSGDKGFQTAVKSQPWKQGRFERSLSYSSSNSTDSPKSSPKSDDLSKGQLLEALRHSQTRAREAEKAAKEACAEKDRLVTILMRQASQILAYKQWIKLLEMESLYLQVKEEEEQGQVEGINLKKRKQRGKKKGEIGRYVMAFALGFSLIGAGLLLGWTVGWLFPF
ncbi:unnamed protein product [Eruca vesicaria subsp. sativa]|uniref:Uncharacterized protein n=1 Tax=Eruca vesicaria subsp. sativa TaxID=29727 RepID=A0ABC8JVE8_ERUVS|nr:unnamed protein product [Eruca vesicaria subsp. sativa]